MPHLAATFTAYDLRHRCATELAATCDLTGAAYLMGHKQVTTLNRYARPEQSAAVRVLAARARATGTLAWDTTQKGRHSAAPRAGDSVMNPKSCGGEDSIRRAQRRRPVASGNRARDGSEHLASPSSQGATLLRTVSPRDGQCEGEDSNLHGSYPASTSS